MESNDQLLILFDLVDCLFPELTAYESSLYLFLIRHSFFEHNTSQIRIGKKRISANFCHGSRGEKTNIEHITNMLRQLEMKGCIQIGDTDRLGTLYTLILPRDIPIIAEKFAISNEKEQEDYFSDPMKRDVIFERDNWVFQYCGEKVTILNVSLDHFIPQSMGGKNTKENLRTCFLVCNSIKSGRNYEAAIPLILKSIQERRMHNT